MLETSFEKHTASLNVFEDTYEDLLAYKKYVILKWECSVHKSEILTEIYTIYIVMRMRQYSYMKNIESKRINKARKKLSELVPTYLFYILNYLIKSFFQELFVFCIINIEIY